MAWVQFFNDGSAVEDVDPESGVLNFADERKIEIVAGTITIDYYGTFTYDPSGDLAGGTFSGFELWDSAHGGLQVSVTGLSIGVAQFFDVASSGDDQQFEQMLFAQNDTMIGSSGNDEFDAQGGADSLDGGAGNDTLGGGQDAFADTLAGGTGDDTFYVRWNDVIVENAGGGNDAAFSDSTYTLAPNVEKLTLTGTEPINGTGNDQANYITGNASNNVLYGMGGNDTLDGGANWDQMYGGSGDDTYITNDYRTDVYESPDEGNDTVMAMKEFILPDNVENIVSIGSSSVYLTGNDLANVITGNNAGDSINGMGGDDTMNGGTGDDTYTVDSVLDVIHDAGGKDLVWAYVDGFVLPAGIENLTLSQGEGPVFGTGNALDNVITGNSYTNVLFGGDGNDTIYGGAGNDTIDGGNGIDHAVFSGAPPSTFLVRQGNDVVVTSVFDGSPVQVLRNIERIDWGGQGGTYHTALDIDGNAGMAYRLYQAAFDRTPDLGGLGYQMHDLDIGVSLEQVASNFIASPEFQRTYGNVDDTQFLTLLYNNVLHRAPDVGGLQYHLDEFAHGQTRADMLIHFSESPENQANVIGAIQNGMEYVW